jgi:hypothetical protein
MKLTTEQYELITWHDNTLHAISLVDEDFKNDLTLDIDYIQEWKNEEGAYRFRVAPAHLVFHDVTGLRINLGHSPIPTMYSYLATIVGIGREKVEENRYLWTIDLLGHPDNRIMFEASGFTQTTYKPAIESEAQHLTADQRTI